MDKLFWSSFLDGFTHGLTVIPRLFSFYILGNKNALDWEKELFNKWKKLNQ